LKERLGRTFEVKDLGPLRYFLEIEIARSSKRYFVPKEVCLRSLSSANSSRLLMLVQGGLALSGFSLHFRLEGPCANSPRLSKCTFLYSFNVFCPGLSPYVDKISGKQ
jgi:hypothetical protein